MPTNQPTLLPFTDACAIVRRQLIAINDSETLPIDQAQDRVIADVISAPLAIPPYRNSAMDGYAFKFNDSTAPMRVVGTAYAGQPYTGEISDGECVRIMTGALLPEPTDTVAMQEHVTVEDNCIRLPATIQAGANVRHAGEDYRLGETVFSAGHYLRAPDIAVLAALGIATVKVIRRLRVVYFTSGDELQEPGQPLAAGQLYNSNRYALAALLERAGIDAEFGGNLPDRLETLTQRLQAAAEQADVIITCGAVSVGTADHIAHFLAEQAKLFFAKLAIKPGKPMHFARLNKAWLFGLPGNPVSAMVTFLVLVQPALFQLMGAGWREPIYLPARLQGPIRKRPGRLDFQRGIAARLPDGTIGVGSTGPQGSHLLGSISRANCLMLLPADAGDIAAESVIDILPLGELYDG